jgi:flagellar biosynthesis protein FlhG
VIREADPPRTPCPFVLVTGGKGGVGKSTLAANLSVVLAQSGVETLLVDLDLGLANLDVLLDLERRADMEDLLAGARTLEDCVVRGPAGLSVLPASSGVYELAHAGEERRHALLSEIARAAAGYEIVVGDTAAGIGEDVLAFAAAADRVLLVTTPEPAALTDAYGVLKALDAWSRAAGREVATPELVVNQAAGAEEARGVAARLRSAAERFLARSPQLIGWLPRSRTVQVAACERRPFALADPASPAARRLSALAERLAPASLKAQAGHVR